MRYLSLIVLAWPLLCATPPCDLVWLCAGASVVLAGSLFVVFAVLRELRALSRIDPR